MGLILLIQPPFSLSEHAQTGLTRLNITYLFLYVSTGYSVYTKLILGVQCFLHRVQLIPRRLIARLDPQDLPVLPDGWRQLLGIGEGLCQHQVV